MLRCYTDYHKTEPGNYGKIPYDVHDCLIAYNLKTLSPQLSVSPSE